MPEGEKTKARQPKPSYGCYIKNNFNTFVCSISFHEKGESRDLLHFSLYISFFHDVAYLFRMILE